MGQLGDISANCAISSDDQVVFIKDLAEDVTARAGVVQYTKSRSKLSRLLNPVKDKRSRYNCQRWSLSLGDELAVFVETPEPESFCPNPCRRPKYRQIRIAGGNQATLIRRVDTGAAHRGSPKANRSPRHHRTAAGSAGPSQKQRRPESLAEHPEVHRVCSLGPK